MRAFRPPSRLFSGLCFLAPPAAAAILLALAPLAALLAGGAGPQAPPLHWDGRLWSILFRSAGLALFAGAGAGALGLGLALWIASRRGPWARGVRSLCFLPLLLPPYLFALTWLLLSLPYGFLASACILGLVLAPLGAWTSLNALRRMDREALEAGLLMGGGGATWRWVVLPAVLPSALAGATLAFALALVEYGVPALMQCSTLSVEIAADFSQYGSPLRALILALPLALPAGALAAAAAYSRGFLNGGTRETGSGLLAATPLPAGLALWSWLALGAWLATLMVP
ncbi:MAG: ABC transporter permease subunit, partial [Acidobacteriota bacterium]